MGAKHPQDLINKLSANKNEFILACSYLVRMGIVKRGGDAIRYIEHKNLTVEQIFEQYYIFKNKSDIVENE